jgi:hypothetical protein
MRSGKTATDYQEAKVGCLAWLGVYDEWLRIAGTGGRRMCATIPTARVISCKGKYLNAITVVHFIGAQSICSSTASSVTSGWTIADIYDRITTNAFCDRF